MSIEAAKAKLEMAAAEEGRPWSHPPSLGEMDSRQRRALGYRLEAVVLAIEAQLAATRRPESMTCRVCGGAGTGYGMQTNQPCPACGGSGKVRVR